MSYGHLFWKKPINAGFGLLCADKLGKSSLLLSATVRQQPAKGCGRKSRNSFAPDIAFRIFGKPINWWFRLNNIRLAGKNPVKRRTSSGGTTLCGNAWHDLCEKRCRFQRATWCTRYVYFYFCIATTMNLLSLSIEPLPKRDYHRLTRTCSCCRFFID